MWCRRASSRRSPALLDAPDGFAHSVIRAPAKVSGAELREDLQHQVVPVVPLDARYQGQQQITGRAFVRRERQAARVVQVVGDRHGCIISRREASGQGKRRAAEA